MSLAHWIDGWAAHTPGKVAVRCADAKITYAALAADIRRLAGVLDGPLGLTAGDRVAFLGLNSPTLLSVLFACVRIGAVFVPLNWRLTAEELGFMLDHSGAAAVFADQAFVPTLETLKDRLADRVLITTDGVASSADSLNSLKRHAKDLDRPARLPGDAPALMAYTSGTTGVPKGAILSRESFLWNAVNCTQMHDLTADDHVLATIPMFHVGGINIQSLPTLHAGATLTIHSRFDPGTTLATIGRDRPTLTILVPTQMAAVTEHPDWPTTDLSSLRMVTTGSTMVPVSLIERFHERGVPVVQVFGATETGGIAVYQRRADACRTLGSTGKAAIHCQFRVVDDSGQDVRTGVSGEIWVRGPTVMTGYWQDPAATAAALRDGWFLTGDIGHCDSDGNLFIDDRKKDMIISGGENIYPAELENILADCADIAEATVVAGADPHWGEVPVAVIVAKPDASLTDDAVRALFVDRLARYKHPRRIVFADALPRNAMGKVRKDAVRDMISQT